MGIVTDVVLPIALATVPPATYSLTMFVTALIYVAVLRRTQGALQR